MKNFIKHSLDYNLTNNPPCNIDPFIGAAIVGGLGSLVSSGFNALGMSNSSKKNFEYNQKLMYQQQQYNTENMFRQSKYNKELARYGYELENEFNSPSVQKQKMLSAGLNPYYNEQGAVTAQSNPNMQQVSQPTLSIPNFQSQSPWSAFANLPADFAAISNAYKALADAKKVGVDTKQQEAAMQTYLADLYERWRGSKLANDYQEVISTWYQSKGHHYLDEKQRELTAEIGDKLADGDLKAAQKLFVEAQKDKQLKDNALFDKIKGFLEDKAKFEAKNAEEQVNTTIAQGEMYKNQGIASLRASDAAISQALTAEANGKAYRVQLRSAAKLNDAQITKMASELVGAYVDEHGLHVDENERRAAQQLLKRQIVAQTKSMDAKAKQDRFNTYNPFTYLGQIFGGSGSAVISKAIK